MAGIIAPGVIRYSIVASLLGEECINIVDVDLEGEPVVGGREAEAFLIAGDIINNWEEHVLNALGADYTFVRVDWVDLDSADGSVGSRSETSDVTLPQSGRQSGQAVPGHTYARCRKNLDNGTRQTRRGMMRLSGLTEEQVSGNNLVGGTAAGIASELENFKDGINGQESGGTRNLCVVHNPDGGPVTNSHIASFTVDPVVGTIRRRMPGYGN